MTQKSNLISIQFVNVDKHTGQNTGVVAAELLTDCLGVNGILIVGVLSTNDLIEFIWYYWVE